MTESTATPSAQPLHGAAPTGARRAGLVSLPPLLMAFLGLGVVQIFLAGLGVFSLNGEQLGSAGETAFNPHRTVGNVMAAVALLIVIAVVVARPGRPIVIMAVSLFLVVGVLQSVLGNLGLDTPVFGGLHALFGIGSLGLASTLLVRTRAALPGKAIS
jgi:hypothetical protein